MDELLKNDFKNICKEISEFDHENSMSISDDTEITVAALLLIASQLDRIADSVSKIAEYGVITLP